MKTNFEIFMSQLQETNQTLDFFCNFGKISKNVEDIKLSLCILNSLIGSTNLRKSVETIWLRDKTAFSIMDVLIAVRGGGQKKVLNSKGETTVLNRFFESVDGVVEYLETTGLADILTNGKIKNLVDYVFGIETGLDSNARKNRSGYIMENMVSRIFDENHIAYKREVKSATWSEIKTVLGDDEKRFDFVVETQNTIYLIEVNFYSGGGSKLNEVARSYSDIAPKVNSVSGFEFVWITDGLGWKSAKNKLQEAYNIIPHIYNLTSIDEFICLVKSKDHQL